MEYIHQAPIEKLCDGIEDLLHVQDKLNNLIENHITFTPPTQLRKHLRDINVRIKNVLNLLSNNSDRFLLDTANLY